MALSKSFLGSATDDASGTTLTIANVNTTGMTHIVVFGKHEGATTTLSVADDKGSGAYTGLTMVDHTNNDLGARMFWVKIGTPGTNTNITLTCADARPFRRVEAWGVTSGTGELAVDAESNNQGSAGFNIDAGSLVTTTATVSFQGTTPYTSTTYSAGSGWTEDLDDTIHGQSRADASGTLDPVCTSTVQTDWVSCSASFKEAAGGGGGGAKKRMLAGLLAQRALRV